MAVFYPGPAPTLIDIDTGTTKDLPPEWPPVPIVDVAFRSMREGAARFHGLGLGVTTDGRKTFRPMTADNPDELTILAALSRRGDALRAAHGRWQADIDLQRAHLSALSFDPDSQSDATARSPTLRWIHATSTDPLHAAVTRGSREPSGAAVAAVRGAAARVDLATGRVFEVALFGPDDPKGAKEELDNPYPHRHRPPRDACEVAQWPELGMIFCPGSRPLSFLPRGPLEPRPSGALSMTVPEHSPPIPEAFSSYERLIVGENGLKLGPWLRVGWEKEAPYSPRRASPPRRSASIQPARFPRPRGGSRARASARWAPRPRSGTRRPGPRSSTARSRRSPSLAAPRPGGSLLNTSASSRASGSACPTRAHSWI